MASRARLENFAHTVLDVIQRGLPGDIVETGVWKGGCSIVAKSVVVATGDKRWQCYSWIFRLHVYNTFRRLPFFFCAGNARFVLTCVQTTMQYWYILLHHIYIFRFFLVPSFKLVPPFLLSELFLIGILGCSIATKACLRNAILTLSSRRMQTRSVQWTLPAPTASWVARSKYVNPPFFLAG